MILLLLLFRVQAFFFPVCGSIKELRAGRPPTVYCYTAIISKRGTLSKTIDLKGPWRVLFPGCGILLTPPDEKVFVWFAEIFDGVWPPLGVVLLALGPGRRTWTCPAEGCFPLPAPLSILQGWTRLILPQCLIALISGLFFTFYLDQW